MRKVKTLARIFWRSLTDPSYYKDILTAKFSFSLKYLFALSFVVSVIPVLLAFLAISSAFPKGIMGGIAAILLSLFSGAVVNFLTSLLFLLPLSLIFFIVARIMKKGFSFAKIYQLSIHGATIPLTLSLFLSPFGLFKYTFFNAVPWLAFLAFMAIVLKKLDTT